MSLGKPSVDANAVVTGAGSGIGRAFAIEIASRGGSVVCADINLAAAKETAAMVEKLGQSALAVRCDVSVYEQVVSLANKAERFFEAPADLIINNAGVGAGGFRIGEIPMDDWKWVMGVNLWGVIHGCQVFMPRLRENQGGGIINVGSTASFSAAPLMGAYNTSKAAVLALSETLAAECVGSGVKVSALCPTFVQTNIMRDGRIAADSSSFADRLMKWTGVPAERVVRQSLNALDRGQLYVMPQLDARLIWRFKRYLPGGYTLGLGLLNRLANKSAEVSAASAAPSGV